MGKYVLRLGAAVVALALPGLTVAADLWVKIDGVAHERGALRVVLYDSADTFRKEEKALRIDNLPAAVGQVRVRLENLQPGRYAVIAYHDENGDGTLNRFLGMIPTEGYGLSNNPEVSGPPKFEPSTFDVTDGETSVEIKLTY